MGEQLIQTPNGTFVTKEVAKEAGLEVKATRKAATRKAPAKKTKAATAAKKTPTRKAAGAVRRKGK
jgi:hypothetical protein